MVKYRSAVKSAHHYSIPWSGIAFIFPAVIVFGLFKYYPLFKALYTSFYDYMPVNPPGSFVGLQNYIRVLQTNTFWACTWTTFVLFALYIAFGFWPPIIQALMLEQMKKGHKIYRFLYMLPWAVPVIASITLWKWIYNPDYGLLNEALKFVGLGPYLWLSNPALVRPALMLPTILGGGLTIMIYLAAINGISPEIYEAATVDGASAWQKVWCITLPSIRPIIEIQFLLAVSQSFLIFNEPFVMTGGGPANATRTLALLVYEKGFKEYRLGDANAVAMMMFVIIMILTVVQMHRQGYNRD